MDSTGAAELAAARLVALYLLSLVAVAGADLAWRPPSLARLFAHAAFLLLSVLLLLPACYGDEDTHAAEKRDTGTPPAGAPGSR